MKALFRFLAVASWVGSQALFAAPRISISADPSRSRNGEPVAFKIRIQNERNENIYPPRAPQFVDWRLLNSYSGNSTSVVMKGGKVQSLYIQEFTYILKPQRSGELTVPSFYIQVGRDTYKTEEFPIRVDQVSRSQPQPNPNRPEPKPGFPFSFPDEEPLPSEDEYSNLPPTSPLPDDDNASQKDLFLRGEVSKTRVFVGELIVLDYAIFQRSQNLRNPEIAKFPDFKGFLKEELSVPKRFSFTPVRVGNRNYLRSTLIKYAIFPLKAGELRIEPMQFRAEAFVSPADLLNQIMQGQFPDPLSQRSLPLSQASQEIRIQAQPLPPFPHKDAQFLGGVGEFVMDVKAPTGTLSVNQPFTLQVHFRGQGNIKVLEEPIWKVPEGVEPFETKAQVQFREDATGTKTFEYLFLPRSAGTYNFEGLKVSTFNPNKAQYEIHTGPALSLTIEGSALPENTAPSTQAQRAPTLFQPEAVSGAFVGSAQLPQLRSRWLRWGYSLQIFLSALAVFLFRKRRLEAELETLLTKTPWELTRRKILSQSSWKADELSHLLDQWLREKIAGLLSLEGLHSESPREEYMEALRGHLTPEHYSLLLPLKELWRDLDLERFSQSRPKKVAGKETLNRAERVLQPLVKAISNQTSG